MIQSQNVTFHEGTSDETRSINMAETSQDQPIRLTNSHFLFDPKYIRGFWGHYTQFLMCL